MNEELLYDDRRLVVRGLQECGLSSARARGREDGVLMSREDATAVLAMVRWCQDHAWRTDEQG